MKKLTRHRAYEGQEGTRFENNKKNFLESNIDQTFKWSGFFQSPHPNLKILFSSIDKSSNKWICIACKMR